MQNACALFYQLQYDVGLYVQVVLVIMPDVLDLIIGYQVAVQVDKVRRRVKFKAVVYHAIAQGRVYEQLYFTAEQGCK